TCYPVTLWPIDVEGAELGSDDPVDTRGRWSNAALRIKLRCTTEKGLAKLSHGMGEDDRPIDRLRLYLHGAAPPVHPLYELIFNHLVRVEVREIPASGRRRAKAEPPKTVALPADCIKPVGFELDEGMLPYTDRSFPGYRLLTEFFAFPNKFHF